MSRVPMFLSKQCACARA